MRELSKRQRDILDYINRYTEKKNYPPTIREIAKEVGLNSTSTVHSHLNKLEELKYIKREVDKPRAIEVMKDNSDEVIGINQEILELPVVDKISSALNLISKDNFIDMFKIPSSLVIGTDCFILKAKDDKLSGDSILKDDYMLIDKANAAEDGKLTVVLVNYKKTIVARYYLKDNKVFLDFKSDIHKILEYDPKEIKIIGKVIGNIRVIN